MKTKVLSLILCFLMIKANGQTVACDMITNGSFETGATCGFMAFPVPALPTIPPTLNNWDLQIGTPDLFTDAACPTVVINNVSYPPDPQFLLTSPTPRGSIAPFTAINGNHIIGLQCGYQNSYHEAIKQQMANPFVPGKAYRITFWARTGDDPTNFNPSQLSTRIQFYSSLANATPDGQGLTTLATTNNLTYLAENTINGNNWTSYNTTFTFGGATTEQFIYIGAEVLAGQTKNYTYIDNVSIVEIPSISAPSTLSVCAGSTTTLIGTPTGGIWTSNNQAAATINAGVLTAANVTTTATTNISYTMIPFVNSNGCSSNQISRTRVTVNPLPIVLPITGTTTQPVCTVQLADATSSGIWSSSNTLIATVSNSGLVTSVAATGSVVISYTVTDAITGCTNKATTIVNVQACDPCTAAISNATPITGIITGTQSYFSNVYHIANDITLSGNILFKKSEVIIDPGVTVTIANGASVTIEESHFYTCNGMWKGINVQAGGKLAIQDFDATEPSLIEDAVVAVNFDFPNGTTSNYGGDYLLRVEGSIFNRNQTSIKISNYQSDYFGSTTFPFYINAALFTSRKIDFVPGSLSWISLHDIYQLNNPSVTWNTPDPPLTLTSPLIPNATFPDNVPEAFLKIAGVQQKPDYGIVLNNIGQNINSGIFIGQKYTDPTNAARNTPIYDFTNAMNVFDNLDIGINANASNFTVSNCIFQKPHNICPNGFGINMYNGKPINFSFISGGGAIPNVTSSSVAFFDLRRSIMIDGYENVTINNSTFRTNRNASISPIAQTGAYGIYAKSKSFRNLQINSNEMTNFLYGIYVYNGNTTANGVQATGVIDINSNTIQATHPNVSPTGNEAVRQAIYISGTFAITTTSPKPINCSNNTLDSVVNGIYCTGVRGKNISIVNNNITMIHLPGASASNKNTGITINSCTPIKNKYNIIENNSIKGNSCFTCSQQTGVFINQQKSTNIDCNNVEGLLHGFRFFSDCSLKTRFFDNYMNPSNLYGLTLENNAFIDKQGNIKTSKQLKDGCTSNNSWGGDANAWIGQTTPHFKAYINNSFAYLSPLIIEQDPNNWLSPDGAGKTSASGIAPYQLSNTGANTQSLFYTTNDNNPIYCPRCQWINPVPMTGRVEGNSQEIREAIADGSIDLIGDEAEQELYVLQQRLYEELMNSDSSNSPVLDSFVQNNVWGSFDYIYYTAQYAAQEDWNTVDMLLTYFPSNNIVDDNNYNYFNWVYDMAHGNKNNIDIGQVLELANQCPATNGEVVFAAQELYNRLTERINYFENNCEITNNNSRIAKPKTKHLKKEQINVGIYPNPATSKVNIVGKQMQAITVMDVMGKVVLRQNCNTESLCTINVVNLNSGLYIVQVQQKDGSIITHKLIKQ